MRRWEKPHVAYREFAFRCESCNRDYTLKDKTLMDKAKERTLNAEYELLEHSEKENAVDYFCPECGGPIMKDLGTFLLVCVWCNEEYVFSNGDLQPKVQSKLAVGVR